MKGGEYWSQRTEKAPAVANSGRWDASKRITSHQNQKICGRDLPGKGKGFVQRLQDIFRTRPAQRGVSIGCGNGAKEMHLLEIGLVQHFSLFEASQARIEQGKELALKKGLESQVDFYLVDSTQMPDVHDVDLVYWNAALHHMLDAEAAVDWSYRVLAPGGYFVMDDYVGPNRFQWTNLSLDVNDRIRALLPDHFFQNPQVSGRLFARLTQRVNEEKLIEKDPTEAADSEHIVSAILKYFPDADVIPTGGSVYHLGLRQILQNMDEEKDKVVLDLILLIDDLLIELGDYHFCVAVAQK